MRIERNVYQAPKHAKLKTITINTCGLQVHDSPVTVIRTNGSGDYHILFVRKGYCTIDFDTHTKALREGEFIVYHPEIPQKYIFPEKHSESYYVHFDGEKIPQYINDLNLKPGIYSVTRFSSICSLFDRIIASYIQTTAKSDIYCIAYFLELLCTLSDDISQEGRATPTILSNVINHINTNFNKRINFDEVAKSHGISGRRLAILFKQQAQCTPMQYQEQVRINTAKRYLENSKKSVADISIIIGFNDPLYFSKVFKKCVGVSPREYRNALEARSQSR